MIRNLKVLGLALVAVFALTAVAASVASAQEKGWITSTGPFTLKGEERVPHAVGANALTAFGLRVECPTSTYTGHKLETTPHALLPNKSTDVTLTPHYKQENCKVFPGSFPATVDMNSCDYVAHLGNTTPAGNKEHTYGVTVDVKCPVGKEITLTIFTNAHDHSTITPFCIVHVKEQLGLKGLHAKDTTNGTIDLSGTVEGIHLNKTNHHAPLLCPAQTSTTGKFDLDAVVKGFNGAGGSTAISISEA